MNGLKRSLLVGCILISPVAISGNSFTGYADVIGTEDASTVNEVEVSPEISVDDRRRMLAERIGAMSEVSNDGSESSKPVADVAPTEKRADEAVVSSTPDAESIAPVRDSVISGIKKSITSTVGNSTALGGSNNDTVMIVEPGVNKIVPVSRGQMNRIVTPFSRPQIFTTAPEDEVVFFTKDNVVYYSTRIPKQPIGVFITDKDDSSASISLTFIALDIEPKEIRIELVGYVAKNKEQDVLDADRISKAKIFESKISNDYLAWLYDFAKLLVNGDVPQGYSEAMPEGGEFCSMPNLDIKIRHILKGASHKVEVYEAMNKTSSSQDVVEPYCWAKDVNMIIPWPGPTIEPGRSIELLIVRRIDDDYGTKRRRFYK